MNGEQTKSNMNRDTLRRILNRIDEARNQAATIPVEGDHKEWIAKMVNGLIDAENAGLTLLDVTAIRHPENEDADPLNTREEYIYGNLQKLIKFDDQIWANVTPAQRFSLARVIAKQGSPGLIDYGIRHPVSGGSLPGHMIGVAFPHIFIGIEPDGYAHS